MPFATPASFDYDDQLQAFITFLQGQEEFKDFNFEGSAIRQLLRILSYNSMMRSYTNAFMFNELSFSSADLRENVASGSAPMGYVPNSRIGAILPAKIIVNPGARESGNTLTMPKGMSFFAAKDGSSLPFSPIDDYTVNKSADGTFVFDNVSLKQGEWVLRSFTVQTRESVESFDIDDPNIDITTLRVAVFPDAKSTTHDVWNRFMTAYDLGPQNKLYYLRETRDGIYTIDFGDGVVSARPDFGSVVVIEYMTTQGANGNQIASVAPSGSIGGFFDVEVLPIDETRSYGGSEREDIEVIRRMAPLSFAASGNAVTPDDYITIIKKIFPEAQDVVAYGGEFAEPPKFGYTMVGIKPKNSDFLTDVQKKALIADLSKYNVGSITPIITDPTYTYIDLSLYVDYNPKRTVLSGDGLKGKIENMCRSFSAERLEKFASAFNYGDFADFVRAIDKAIRKAIVECTYRKTFLPQVGYPGAYAFVFEHEIKKSSVLISGFRVADTNYTGFNYFIKDDGQGILNLTKENAEGTVVRITNNIGTVDYTTGTVKISKFNPTAIVDGVCTVRVTPEGIDQSLSVMRDVIIEFGVIDVEMEAVNV